MISVLIFLLIILFCSGHPIDNSFQVKSIDDSTSYFTKVPKWHNHCKSVDSSDIYSSFESNSDSIIEELLQKITKTSLIAKKSAEDLKRKFVDFENIFNDLEELRFKQDFRWLPELSRISVSNFNKMTKEMALLEAHQYIEKFAVALEQIVFDRKNQNINDVYNVIESNHFKNIDDNNYSVLCEIRITMSVVFGSINEHFITQTERSIMPQELRYISEDSRRMIRDYLILRQYVKTTHFISKLFEYFSHQII